MLERLDLQECAQLLTVVSLEEHYRQFLCSLIDINISADSSAQQQQQQHVVVWDTVLMLYSQQQTGATALPCCCPMSNSAIQTNS